MILFNLSAEGIGRKKKYKMKKAFIQQTISPKRKLSFEQWVKELAVDNSEQVEINSQTKGQGQNFSWIQARVGRITGTRAGSVLQAQTAVKKNSALKEVLGLSQIPSYARPAIRWGVTQEQNAIDSFLMLFGIKHFEQKGLLVDKSGILAVSPDLICHDPRPGNTKQFLLEIKCPFMVRQYKSLDDAISSRPKFYIAKIVKTDGSVGYSLRVDTEQGYKYYCQIMLSLYITKLPFAILYVWTPFFSTPIFIQRNLKWEEENIPKLVDFWMKYIGPEVFKLYHQLKMTDFCDKPTAKAVPRDQLTMSDNSSDEPPEKKLIIKE